MVSSQTPYQPPWPDSEHQAIRTYAEQNPQEQYVPSEPTANNIELQDVLNREKKNVLKVLKFRAGVNTFSAGSLTFWSSRNPWLFLLLSFWPLISVYLFVCLLCFCHIHDAIPQLFRVYSILAYFLVM
ncbi:hypothetical protein L211DRAFT_692177 [Terfezia boudieri ATCC MYA-4762]|uniref:Uncharacterized protein n=1 Tax=Terfezia boudieri ATCC MYA-4762 TaxID=1051890 RepID=A0A3N4LDD0_9PEZI|nr:hypothetical protein L211DRAFT_692177 [Terfezia boudieri ATCC MYA-4762]